MKVMRSWTRRRTVVRKVLWLTLLREQRPAFALLDCSHVVETTRVLDRGEHLACPHRAHRDAGLVPFIAAPSTSRA